MATKEDPGEFDCYAKAKPDEPLFVLLARDELAPGLVRLWALLRDNDSINRIDSVISDLQMIAAKKPPMKQLKWREAMLCAGDMEKWLRENPDASNEPKTW